MEGMEGAWRICSALWAIWATISRTAELCTDSMGSFPHVKGPWEDTSTAGMSNVSQLSKVSIITSPVFFSYAPATSSGVMGRVQGMAPLK